MTVMIQASVKDALGNLYNVKAEGDEPNVVWTDFGAVLAQIDPSNGAALAVRATLTTALSGQTLTVPAAPAPFADPLAAAVATVQNSFPNAAPVAQSPALPGAVLPSCQHGQKKIVRSKPGSGKTWVALGCVAGQNDPTKCNPGLDFDAARDLGL